MRGSSPRCATADAPPIQLTPTSNGKWEAYWSLVYLQQQGTSGLTATILKEDLVRIDGLPLVTRASVIPFWRAAPITGIVQNHRSGCREAVLSQLQLHQGSRTRVFWRQAFNAVLRVFLWGCWPSSSATCLSWLQSRESVFGFPLFSVQWTSICVR